MTSVASLALPFFGLIFLGFLCAKLVRFQEVELRMMNFFIVYVALPVLFFKLVAVAPFEQLANWPYVFGTTISTYVVFSLAFAVGMIATRGKLREATIMGVVGSYSNIGYMGPGLTLAALGQDAIVPTALIFVFDNCLLFTLVPFLMALGGSEKMKVGATAWYVVKRVTTHPFNIATAVAVLAADVRFVPPAPVDAMLTFLKNAAAPCALFTLGVTVALRPLRQVPREMPALMLIKLVIHPLLVWVVLSWIGNFPRAWVFTAVLMAALPQALNVFVIANQYQTYVERASTAVLIGTLISVVTVTGLLVLITENRIPVDLFP